MFGHIDVLMQLPLMQKGAKLQLVPRGQTGGHKKSSINEQDEWRMGLNITRANATNFN